jgi:hypothetical protein
MAWRLFLSTGFITNSSTAIYWIPKAVLDDPAVRTFMQVYGINATDGYIGSDLMSRSNAESLLISRSLKARLKELFDLSNTENQKQGWGCSFPCIDSEDDANLIAIFGDEYTGLTQELVKIMQEALERINKNTGSKLDIIRDEYH